MGIYVFRNASNPVGALSQNRLSTRVLSALERFNASGTLISYDSDLLVESEDQMGERVEIDLQWDRSQPYWHRAEGAEVLAAYGIKVESFPERAD